MNELQAPPDDRPMPLWQHLEDLRKAILRSLVGILIGMIAGWFLREPVLNLLIKPLITYFPGNYQGLTVLSVTEAFFFYMKLAFFTGLFLASPWVFLQLWHFIAPGLYAHERRYIILFVFFTTFFFLLGGWFGYQYIIPLTLKFLLEIGRDFQLMITTTHYFSFFLHLILGIALVFEMPVLCFILARMGILNTRVMMKFWKFAVVGSFILSAVITPSGDMITQSALAFPLIGLYFFSALVVAVAQPREKSIDTVEPETG